ncbi:hypothetical protein D3C78_1155540 [compost metagenome]
MAQTLPQTAQLGPILIVHVVIDHLGLMAAQVVIQPRLAHPYAALGEIDLVAAVIQVVGLEHDAVSKYLVGEAFLSVEIRRAFEIAMGGDDALKRQWVDWIHVGWVTGRRAKGKRRVRWPISGSR